MKTYRSLRMSFFIVLLVACWTMPASAQPERQQNDSFFPGMQKGRPGGSPHRYTEKFLERIKEQNPEEYARLIKLKDNDPQAFHEELTNRLFESRIKRCFQVHPGLNDYFRSLPPEEQQRITRTFFGSPRYGDRYGKRQRSHGNKKTSEKLKKLVKKYKQAETAEDQEQLKAKIIEELEKEFNRRSRQRKKDVTRLEKQLLHFKEKLELREENRDAILLRRFDELTRNDALKW